MTNTDLAHACRRLLATEREVNQLPAKDRDWFMNKPGHRDCFNVARALLKILLRKKHAQSRNQIAKNEEWRREATRKALER